MVSERCHLQRSNHQAEMMSSFTKLLLNESLVDVTLACEGVRLKAHRIVLSACSPYFQEIFEDNPCQHPVVILKGVRFSDLKSIIDFVYQGEVDIKPQNLNCFLKTAKTLQISGLPNCENDITLQNGHLRNDNIPKPQSVINSVSPSMQLSPSLKDTQKSVQSRSVRSVDDKDVNNKGVARDNLETSSPVHLLSFLKTESVEEVVDNDEVNASENNQASFIESHPDMHQMDNLCQPHLCEQANVDWSEQIRINEPWSLPAITRQPADLAVLTKDTNIHVGPQRHKYKTNKESLKHNRKTTGKNRQLRTSKPFVCNFCNQRFTTSANRGRHIKQIHMTGPDSKIYPCALCPRAYNRRDNLQYHLRHMHGITPKSQYV